MSADLPPRVRYDKTLNSTIKLFFLEIMATSDTEGLCRESNAYFAALLNVTPRTITRMVDKLQERGYIEMKVAYGGDPQTKNNERRMWITAQATAPLRGVDTDVHIHPDRDVYTGLDRDVHAGIDTGVHITDINNIINTPHSPPKGGRGKLTREHKDQPDYRPGDFLKLWEWYPTGDRTLHSKRGNKQKAIRAWDKLRPSPKLITTIAKALGRQAESEEWQRGIGIPHLSTYLNNSGWEGWEEDDADGND